MITQFIEKHYFTLKNLSNHIESLELPESDKPAFIDRRTLYSRGSRLNQKVDILRTSFYDNVQLLCTITSIIN